MAEITHRPGTALILASGSPRRRELLERVGIAVDVRPADIDETPRHGEPAVAYARRLATTKSRAIAGDAPGRWVLGADTVVEIDGRILGKPEGPADAGAMLRELAGRVHRVTTAYAVVGPGADAVSHVTTEVELRPVDAAEIDDYVAAGEWRGKAGGYAVQGMAAAMVSAVRGSVTNVIGLPLAEVCAALAAAGAAAPRYREGVPA